ncbi:MAG TPA: hypothetical protein VF192_12195 [Longimicrobiales bacterium]
MQAREKNTWACRWCGEVIELRHDGLDDDRIQDHERMECPVGIGGKREDIYLQPWER